MAVHLTCDYCGDPIDDGHWIKISALGQQQEEGYGSHWELVNEFLGYFHASRERTCYADLWELICLVLNTHSSLNGAPTATGDAAPAELSGQTELQLQGMGRPARGASARIGIARTRLSGGRRSAHGRRPIARPWCFAPWLTSS